MGNHKINRFSEVLSELRKEREMSRRELAEKLNVSVRLVCYWENGQRECSFDTLIAICTFFDVSADYLLGRSDY